MSLIPEQNNMKKRIVDAAMTVLLLCLMAYQVTGEMAHEWIGMGMTVLVIIHQILNRKWYGALFKGKYNPYRSISTVLNILLPAMTAGLKLTDRTKTILACIFTCIGGAGLWLFLRNDMPNYLFFQVPFAFLDYDKAGWQVLLENLLMLSFWAFIGTQTALICRNAAGKV